MREEMRQEMRQEMLAVVLDLLQTRFGPISGEGRGRVAAIDSTEELSRLARRIVTAGSLAELGLEGA